ncbi:class I SAM-dependent methyltransferase [Streptacidiphilus monticola]|uniref:Class I SAM-dependent methyltransferase n=1 Tax=Streptacidiphilus monticola TaxID=2161674 RepID=A0ABW1G6C8_9ACTN
MTEFSWEKEARLYDETRGGEPRAERAAAAIEELLPDGVKDLLDVGGGTGIISRRLAAVPGRRVVVADRSPGMLALGAQRLPGRAVLADAGRLPFRDGCFDAVSCVWLLHLVPDSSPLLREFARVLRPGGVLVCTVDKDAAHDVGSDIDEVLGDLQPRLVDGTANSVAAEEQDHLPRVLATAAGLGLEPAGGSRFPAPGRGRSPAQVAEKIRLGHYQFWSQRLAPEVREDLLARLAGLPDQDRKRPDPVFTLQALRLR